MWEKLSNVWAQGSIIEVMSLYWRRVVFLGENVFFLEANGVLWGEKAAFLGESVLVWGESVIVRSVV